MSSTNIEILNQILMNYGFNERLDTSNVLRLSAQIFRFIEKQRDPLSTQEHRTIFDILWIIGVREHGVLIELPQKLKDKIIANRNRIKNYYTIVCAYFNIGNIPDIIEKCNLNQNEEVDLWKTFHKLNPEGATRDCDEINHDLNLFKFVDSKIKWIGRINVLDLGCGKNGIGISTLVDRYQNKIRGFGVDIAIEEHPSNVKIIKADIRNLPFKNSYFDLIYSSTVIEYIDDRSISQVIKEVLRVMKSKAYFVFNDGRRSFSDYKNNIVPLTDIKARVINRGLIIKY